MNFELTAVDGLARAGMLRTPHADIETPVFMPVGTQAAVKTLVPDDLCACGTRMLLANAYHCYLRPGADIIARAGGLHGFMAWPHAILTDSGGFQVFSLARLAHVDDEGYHFASHLDGGRHTFTPESVVALQEGLGADVAMVLDDCAPAGVDSARACESADRTLRWAQRALNVKQRADQMLFAIAQGSTFDGLRREQARALGALDFAGYGIGGLWVGEARDRSVAMVRAVCEELPAAKPRYLMGVGTPGDIITCMAAGVDMFDCVYPTRCARHGLAMVTSGRLNLRNARFAADFTPLDATCDCPTCSQFTRAYLAHCFRAGEVIGPRLVSQHNVAFLSRLTREARAAIVAGRFADWSAARLACDGGG
ncbi:MAG: tRNA guanosine(34) transglycosylase Tgt [Candidatus Eremiobacteraeota bacterium]|nr:tRNA guanosine(34) transglycosylase Tgt [Candidatus Eremiobacteraeota bacterium]